MIGLSPESHVTSKPNIIQCWWLKKTLLEKQLLIGVVAVTVTTFGFLIEATVHSRTGATEVCATTQCVTASSKILNQMDETVDPCDDFFKFACGTMSRRTHSKNIPLTSFRSKLLKQLINFLTEPINPNDQPYFNFVKNLFTSCVREAEDGTSLKVFKSILSEIGGWPLSDKWTDANFNWVDLIGKLKDKGMNHKVMIDINLHRDPSDNTTVYWLDMNIPYMDRDVYTPSYKNLMIETAVLLGVDEDIATEAMTKVFNFSLKIEQLRRYTNSKNRTRLLLSEVQSNYKEIDWKKIINLNLEPLHTASQNDYIEIQYSSFLKEFVSLLSSTDLSTLMNYIWWFAIADIMPLISNQALEVTNQFYCINSGPTTNAVAECGDKIFRVVNLAPFALAYTNRYVPKTARKKIKSMLDLIVKEFKKMISKDTWIDEETATKTYKWLDHLKYIIAIDSDASENIYAEIPKAVGVNDQFLTKFLKTKKDRFFQSLVEIKYKNYTTAYSNFHSLTGFISSDTVMFPPGILQGLYFDENRPMYMNFGILGASISSLLVSFYTSEYLNRNIWSQEVRKLFRERINCVTHNSEHLGVDGMTSTGITLYGISLKNAKTVGLKLAYNAYKSWTQENGKEPWTGLNYTDVQLFWISSYSYACYEVDEKISHNYHSDSENVRQNFDFAIDFDCGLDSNMNPSNKCVVF